MKIIFADIDGPFCSSKNFYIEPQTIIPFYQGSNHMVTYDPFAVKFFNNLFEQNDDLYVVLHSTWRKEYGYSFLMKHFELQGCKFRWHTDWTTDPNMTRWDSIRQWLYDHPEIGKEDYCIVDDEKPPVDLKSRTVVVNEHDGLSDKNCRYITSLLRLNY